jgi:hypothetical protein
MFRRRRYPKCSGVFHHSTSGILRCRYRRYGICRIAACRESVIAGVTGVTREDGAVDTKGETQDAQNENVEQHGEIDEDRSRIIASQALSSREKVREKEGQGRALYGPFSRENIVNQLL